MTISDKPEDIYALAGRCPLAALVLADPTGARFHVLTLGSGTAQIEKETTLSIERGLTEQAGVVCVNSDDQLESVAKTGFSSTILRASAVFLYALLDAQRKQRKEVSELEEIARLVDPRAQA
jgi:hypothetical protein